MPGMGPEQGGGMSAPAEGGVDDQARGHRANSSTTSVVMTGSWVKVAWLIRSPSTGTMLAGGVPLRSLWGSGGGGFPQRSGRGTAHGPDSLDVHIVTGDGGEAGLEGRRSVEPLRHFEG